MTQYAIMTLGCVLLTAAPAVQASGDPNDLLARSRQLRRQFIAEKSAVVAEPTNVEADVSLAALIDEVLSLQTPPTADKYETLPDGRVTGRGVPAAGTSAASSHSGVPASASPVVADGSKGRIDDLPARLAEVESPLHPLELGDALYRIGRIDEAGRFYRIALDATDEDAVLRYQWALFQTANCLRQSDPEQAKSLYRELIGLFPNSSWTPVAQARLRTLEWLHLNHNEIARRAELP